jgi:hypothetical protein
MFDPPGDAEAGEGLPEHGHCPPFPGSAPCRYDEATAADPEVRFCCLAN